MSPDDDRIREYLLGRLPEQEREACEADFFRDDTLFEQVRAIEDDLIDDYVTGALSAEARAAFDSHFLTSPARQRRVELAGALQQTVFKAVPPPPTRVTVVDRLRALLTLSEPARVAVVMATLLVLLSLVPILTWERMRHRQLEQQTADAHASIDTLKKENESLREMTAALKTDIDSTNVVLRDRLEQLDALTAVLAQRGIRPPVRLALQDTTGPATLRTDGTVSLAAQGVLSPELSRSVRELVTTGIVTPERPVVTLMAALRDDLTRGALPSGRGSITPVSPVLTAVRSDQPRLEWKATPGAREYKVTVADRDGAVVWQSSGVAASETTIPPNLLQRGRLYLWQVEAAAGGQSSLSPPVGFWVLDQSMVRAVEDAERAYRTSALVLAAVYASHGLNEEALTQVERLAQINAASREVQTMLNGLRRAGQLGP